MVGLAGRYAAGGNDEIMRLRGDRDRAREPSGVVRQDAEIARRGTEGLDEPREQVAIGIEQSWTRAGRARIDDLVPGREHGDADTAEHLEGGQTDRRRQRDVL